MKDSSGSDKTILSADTASPTHGDGDESYCAACGGSYPMDLDNCPKDGARLTKLKAQPDAMLGRIFDGRYEVRTQLGQGGMGTVYRGWQLTVDREIAIKVIHPKLASDRTAVKRFLREARLSSRLNQPNIVNVYDFNQLEDGTLFIAMELVRGHTLGRELEAMRPLALKRVLTIALQLCDALDSAHGQGIIHRDLKPNNIIILDDPPGRDLIKVLDFGLAKSLVADTSSLITNTNAILGTPLYMPPEQIEGKDTDQRADLYSLGCILYQMLSGRPPHVADSVNLVLAAHVSDKPAPLPTSVPDALEKIVERMMAKDPAKRMTSAREAREAMQAVLEGGYSTDIADTTPDVRPALLETGPIELAETAHAIPGPTTSQHGAAQPLSVEKSIDRPAARPMRRSRLVLIPIGLVVLASGIAVGVKVIGRDNPRAPIAAPAQIDAAIVPSPSASPLASPTPSPSPVSSESPSPSPSTPVASPSSTPVASPSSTPVASPSPSPSKLRPPIPRPTPRPTPIASPTPSPTSTPHTVPPDAPVKDPDLPFLPSKK